MPSASHFLFFFSIVGVGYEEEVVKICVLWGGLGCGGRDVCFIFYKM